MSTSAHNGSHEPFRPQSGIYEKKLPVKFQAKLEIDGEFGQRVVKAQRASGLTAVRFVRACVEYALDHMEAE